MAGSKSHTFRAFRAGLSVSIGNGIDRGRFGSKDGDRVSAPDRGRRSKPHDYALRQLFNKVPR